MESKSIPFKDTSATKFDLDSVNKYQLLELRYQEMEERFRAMQERFEYMQQATHDAVWDWDLVANKGWYSAGMQALFGYSADAIGDGVSFWYDNIHPEDKDRVVKGIHDSIDHGGKNWNDRYRFRRTDGTYAWVFDRGYALHDPNGRPIRMVGSMQDISKEVEAREALKESETRFRATFDQAAVGIAIASLAGEWVTTNHAYPKIFGYDEHEFRLKKPSDINHPEESVIDQAHMKSLLAGDNSFAAREKRYIHKEGHIVWGKLFASLIRDSQGNPQYFLSIVQDITEQKRMQETLRESEDDVRLAVESAQLGTWTFNPKTRIIKWDKRCKELFGMRPDAPVDWDIFLSGVHPEDRARVDQTNQLAMTIESGGFYDTEYRTIGLEDQKVRWIRAKGRGYFDEKGIIYRYAGTVLDITEQKEREEKLKVEEERFRFLATSIPQIVWTTDVEGRVEYISDKWELYTGRKPEYTVGSFSREIHPEDREKVLLQWKDSAVTSEAFDFEYRLVNDKTGEARWFKGTAAPLKDEQGKVIKWIGSATDIHDQKLLEMELEQRVNERTRELIELNARLGKSNAELEQYAYVASHDLKEPLRKIQTFSSIITQRYGSEVPPHIFPYLEKIQSSADRMSGLIKDLLEFSRLSNRHTSFAPVDLDKVLHEVLTDFELLLQEKKIEVHADRLPVVNGILHQLRQLVFNLVANAVKFSKQDQSNTIRITCSKAGYEEIKRFVMLSPDRPHFKITFEDSGIGFNQAYGEQIFTIFQRLNDRVQYEGHGIGLALCRKIVDNHQGVIFAAGAENVGAAFTIIIPSDVQDQKNNGGLLHP